MAHRYGSAELEGKIKEVQSAIDKLHEQPASAERMVKIRVLCKERISLMKQRPRHHVPQHGAYWI